MSILYVPQARHIYHKLGTIGRTFPVREIVNKKQIKKNKKHITDSVHYCFWAISKFSLLQSTSFHSNEPSYYYIV